MPELNYSVIASDYESLRHIIDRAERDSQRAVLDSQVQLDQAVSLAIIADALQAVTPKGQWVEIPPVTSDDVPASAPRSFMIGDRVSLDEGLQDPPLYLVDDLAIREDEPAAYLVAEREGDLTALWVFTSNLVYVDHPRDSRGDEDSDLQDVTPADDDPEGDFATAPLKEIDGGFAKAQQKAKKGGKK